MEMSMLINYDVEQEVEDIPFLLPQGLKHNSSSIRPVHLLIPVKQDPVLSSNCASGVFANEGSFLNSSGKEKLLPSALH